MPSQAGSEPVAAPVDPESGWRGAAGEAGHLRALARGQWHPLQSYPDRTAYRVVDLCGRSRFVKHYHPTGLLGRIKDFAVRRRPQRAWSLAGKLCRGGVGTPTPVSLFLRGTVLPREALLVNEWAGQGVPWAEHLTGRASKLADPQGFDDGLSELATLLGRLHRLGLYHGDLPGNLFFFAEGGRHRPCLVDLEELRPCLPRRRRVKNLEELGRALADLRAVSLRDRWGFLRAYAAAAALSIDEARRLWREGRSAQNRRLARRAQRPPNPS